MTASAHPAPSVGGGFSAHTFQHSLHLHESLNRVVPEFSLSKVDGCNFYLPGVCQGIICVCQNCPAEKFRKDTKRSFKLLTCQAFLTFRRLIQHKLTTDRLEWKCAFVHHEKWLSELRTPTAKSISLELWVSAFSFNEKSLLKDYCCNMITVS